MHPVRPDLARRPDGRHPDDFQPYPGYESPDGKVAKGTQEELLIWMHSDEKDRLWEAQYDFRTAVAGHMNVARETIAWIYRNSLDLSGFIDGTGNPLPEDHYSTPASGSYYFAPSADALEAALA